MADVDAAIDYTLRWEDESLSGVITTNDDDLTKTRFGIDQRFHPELKACGFYSDMGSVSALPIARNIYREHYAEPMCIEQIANQEVANKLLSLGVNIGIETAARMLQLAVHAPGDGSIGPKTLFALANADPVQVHDSLDDQAISHYYSLVDADPSKKKYLDGWLRRAAAV